ncbi:hypothetical protein BC826DRAFT_967709 [Russula brevipes]|nr:hypothetical protein BC826DRAFT_967709 [Russula brevipes]
MIASANSGIVVSSECANLSSVIHIVGATVQLPDISCPKSNIPSSRTRIKRSPFVVFRSYHPFLQREKTRIRLTFLYAQPQPPSLLPPFSLQMRYYSTLAVVALAAIAMSPAVAAPSGTGPDEATIARRDLVGSDALARRFEGLTDEQNLNKRGQVLMAIVTNNEVRLANTGSTGTLTSESNQITTSSQALGWVKEVKSQNEEQTILHKKALQNEEEVARARDKSTAEQSSRRGASRGNQSHKRRTLSRSVMYHKLLDEVGVLGARKQHTDSEATRLGQFNAEIRQPGATHRIPPSTAGCARDLAETKAGGFTLFEIIIVGTRKRDAAGAQIESLRPRSLGRAISSPRARQLGPHSGAWSRRAGPTGKVCTKATDQDSMAAGQVQMQINRLGWKCESPRKAENGP